MWVSKISNYIFTDRNRYLWSRISATNTGDVNAVIVSNIALLYGLTF